MVEILLGWREQDYCIQQANQVNATVKVFNKTHCLRFFYKFHICFVLSVLKKQMHCTYVWRHKGFKAQRVDHVATRLPQM